MAKDEKTSVAMASLAGRILNMSDEEVIGFAAQHPAAIRSCVASLLTQARDKAEAKDKSPALDRITREVAETKTVAASAVTLIEGLAQQIRDLKDDPAALEPLADELDATQATMAAAVAANTPSTGGDTTGGDTGTDTSTGGGEDTVNGGDGGDVVEDEP